MFPIILQFLIWNTFHSFWCSNKRLWYVIKNIWTTRNSSESTCFYILCVFQCSTTKFNSSCRRSGNENHKTCTRNICWIEYVTVNHFVKKFLHQDVIYFINWDYQPSMGWFLGNATDWCASVLFLKKHCI